METAWPGEPRGAWNVATDDPGLWVPGPDALPAWESLEDLHRHYVVVPHWWRRALLLLLVLFADALVLLSKGAVLTSAGRADTGPAALTFTIAVLVVLAVVTLAVAVSFVRWEVIWARARRAVLERVAENLRREHIPVWGLLVRKVRLGDLSPGPNDVPDDFQFLFDLRVPRETLRRQRAAAEVWVDTLAQGPDNVPQELGKAFAGRFSVHCADVFGEEMRGVWLWRKGSVLPHEVLGLALTDPREVTELTRLDVLFVRRTPRELRHRSRMA